MDMGNNDDLHYISTRRVTCLTCRHRLTEDIYLTFCGVEQCVPGFTVGPWVRNNYHLHVIISGKGTLMTEGREYHLHADQVFLLKPGKEVVYKADEESAGYSYIYSADGTEERKEELYFEYKDLIERKN